MSRHFLSRIPFRVFWVAMVMMISDVFSLGRLSSSQKSGIPISFPFKQSQAKWCKSYMETCIPWKTECCGSMTCMNLAEGYCLYPVEQCYCQKTGRADIF